MSEQHPGVPPYASYPAPPSPWVPVLRPPAMPGTVRAATIVTYVCSAIGVGMTLLAMLFVTFVGSFVLPMFRESDRVSIVIVVLAGVASSLAFAGLACWFAWQTGQRKGGARIGLAVCSGLTVVLCALTFSPPTLVGLLGGFAVLVLLFVPESNAWFRDAD